MLDEQEYFLHMCGHNAAQKLDRVSPGRHMQTHLECQLGAVFILAGGGGSNAMIPGIVLWGGDCGLNVTHTLEL